MQTALRVIMHTPDGILNEAHHCVRLAQQVINPVTPAPTAVPVGELTNFSLDGVLVVGVVILKKGIRAASYHSLPSDEQKVREKVARRHQPLLVAALAGDQILCAATGYKLVDLDQFVWMDPRVRERLKMTYEAKSNNL